MDRSLILALWASNHCISLWSNTGRFLTGDERRDVREAGMLYLRSHVALAEKAITDEKRLYRIRPKLHLLHHLFVRDGCANPHCYSTWMDEDALKHLMKTLRCTDRRTAEERLLQRWLLGLPSSFEAVRGKLRSRPIPGWPTRPWSHTRGIEAFSSTQPEATIKHQPPGIVRVVRPDPQPQTRTQPPSPNPEPQANSFQGVKGFLECVCVHMWKYVYIYIYTYMQYDSFSTRP